ncbi:MAG: RNA-binding S4 domain-containing protein [Proteobacteria bacterium]|nr:RNA-binding S4 domain-containing protein [Pseudomonadota bacterium]
MDDETSDLEPIGPAGSLRLDKWLWFARVVRTRTLAAGLVTDGRVRVNRERVLKPSQPVRAGDVITIAVGPRVRVLQVTGFGERRGSATDAQALFRDLSEAEPANRPASAPSGRDQGAGRPTKRDRRAIDRLRGDDDG